MNPPWEAVKPEDDDFFSQFYPTFRKMKSKPEKDRIKQKLLKDKHVEKAFNEYVSTIQDKVSFYKLSGQYVKRGSGDTDMWKLFLERAWSLCAKNGTISVVIPYGIITNEGAKQLRILLLENRIRYLYEFENAEGIFPDVHRSYKFALLVVDKREPLQSFPAAFYLHSIDALDGRSEADKLVNISTDFVKLVSPEILSIPEVRNEKEVKVFQSIYNNHPNLSKGIDNEKWIVRFVREMDRTGTSHLFRNDGKGWTLMEGKHFHQFIPDYEKPYFSVIPYEGLKWTSKIREYGNMNKEFHNVCRLAFRDVASSTNVRGMISCILPKHTFLPHTAPIVVPRHKGQLLLDERYYGIIAYLAGIFNSMVFDFLIRRRITTHLSYFFIEETPIPLKTDDSMAKEIIKISARLNSPDKRFEELARSAQVEYGPITMKQRIEMTAKLDALVAIHYGISRDEYEYIINTFDGFREDANLENMINPKWDDELIRKLNGEVRKRVLNYYDCLKEVKGH